MGIAIKSTILSSVGRDMIKIGVDGGHFEKWPLKNLSTLLREASLLIFLLTLKEGKSTKKRTYALHGHGTSRNDPTK